MKKYRCWSQFFSNDQGNQSLQNVGTIAIAATVLIGLLQVGKSFEDRGRERLEELLAGRNNSEAAATIERSWENSGVISTIETSTESSAKADLNSGALQTSDISDEVLMASFNFSEATSSSDSGNSTSKTTLKPETTGLPVIDELKSGITSISGSIATGLPLSPKEDGESKDTLEENESADEVTEVTETTVTQTTRESITEPENVKNAGILIRPQATMAAKSPSVKPPGNTNASQGAGGSASPLSSFSGSGSAGAGTSPSGVSGAGGGSLGAAGPGGSGSLSGNGSASPLGFSPGGQGSFGSPGFSPDSSNAGYGKPLTNPDSDSDVGSQSTTTGRENAKSAGSDTAASIAETAGRLRDAILGGNRRARNDNDTQQDSGRLLESGAADNGSMNGSSPPGSTDDNENVSAEIEEQGGETDNANEDPDDIQDALPQQIRILGLDRTEPEKPRLRIALGESFEQIQIHADEQKLAFQAPAAGSISTIPLTPSLTEPGSEILLIGISQGVRVGVYYEIPVAAAPSPETDISGNLATDSSIFQGEEL